MRDGSYELRSPLPPGEHAPFDPMSPHLREILFLHQRGLVRFVGMLPGDSSLAPRIPASPSAVDAMEPAAPHPAGKQIRTCQG